MIASRAELLTEKTSVVLMGNFMSLSLWNEVEFKGKNFKKEGIFFILTLILQIHSVDAFLFLFPIWNLGLANSNKTCFTIFWSIANAAPCFKMWGYLAPITLSSVCDPLKKH